MKSRNALKSVAALVVIVAIVTLAIIAVKSKGDSTETKGALVFTRTPSNASATLPGSAAIATDTTSGLNGLSPLAVDSPVSGVPTNAPAPSGDNSGAPDTPVSAQLTCPAPLPPATHDGGIANLQSIIPAFGPFSAEAFAFLPALQPGFPVLGPFFPVFEAMLAAGQPLLDAGIPVLNTLEQAGFDTLAPLYGPVRPQVLAGEAQLANALNPIVNQLATAPGSGCIADIADIFATLLLAAF